MFLLTLSCALSFAQRTNDSQKTVNQINSLDSLKKSMSEMMVKYNLKGLSVAVFENYKIIWTNEWGVKASDSNDKIDQKTAFSTASISKPIVAIVCAMLEEKGLINLDDPINNYLKRWKLPKNHFTDGNDVTWNMLLSHTAGTSQGGFEDYYVGDSIPTIVQSLQGKLLPRSKKPIEFLFKPGTNWEYSGGGYVIIQCALEDHLKKPLAQIVKDNIIDPLRLQNSTMIQPNEQGFLTNIAKVHNSKGEIIRTGIPITPQVAPSGLWSTPTDLALIAIEMQKALSGKDNKIISTAVSKKVTDIVTMNGPRGWSYGWQRSLGFGNQEWFSHDGSNTGTGGDLLATMKKGNGIAVLANGDKPNRLPVMCYIEKEIITRLHWNKPINETEKVPSALKEAIKGYYTEILYGYDRLGTTKIFEENNHLYLNSPYLKDNFDVEKNKMYYIGNNSFRVENYPNIIQFNLDQNKLIALTISRPDCTQKILDLSLSEIRTPQTQLIEIFSENDFTTALNQFKKLKLKYPDHNFEENLNNFGYSSFNKKQIELSIQIFTLNCSEYPESANAFDSLGEVYEATGKLQLAKQNYQKSLELNPKNENAKQMILKINTQLQSK